MSSTALAPDLIARAVIWKNDALLVNGNTNRKTGDSYVALPGGHVDPGENFVEALQREIEEELAARCEVGDLLFVCEHVYEGRKKEESRRHELTLFFAATIEGETTHSDGSVESPEEWKNFHWLPRTQLTTANLLPLDSKRILLGEIEARYAFSDTRAKRDQS